LKYFLLPRAREDLQAIWSYTADEWGVDQADYYIGQIVTAFERAVAMPHIGSAVFGLPTEYRKARSGAHRIIYRTKGDQLIVVRILHEREDVPEGMADV
jgi:toxin ParE1/3/4